MTLIPWILFGLSAVTMLYLFVLLRLWECMRAACPKCSHTPSDRAPHTFVDLKESLE
jgi:hypothetical protein